MSVEEGLCPHFPNHHTQQNTNWFFLHFKIIIFFNWCLFVLLLLYEYVSCSTYERCLHLFLISYASFTILFIYTVSVSQPFFDVSNRFLVHRYSVLQQHAEANGIEGVDDLDTLEVGKTHYHDDSDEVQTSPHC